MYSDPMCMNIPWCLLHVTYYFEYSGLRPRSAKFNSAKTNILKHILTGENCRFGIICAFDSAHVRYSILIKAGPQPLFLAEPGKKNG